MLSLLRTFIGTLFFFCCFGVVLLKNSPQDYRLAFNQNTNIPWATVKGVLSLDDIREKYNEANFINGTIRTLPSQDLTVKRYLIPTVFYFDLIEEWEWNEKESVLQLTYSYTFNFLSRLSSLNVEPKKVIRTYGQSRFESIQKKAHTLLHKHRWEYNGEETLPLTYYLAIEGENTWEELNSSVKKGQEAIKLFAKKKAIELLKDEFVLYPSINEKKIRWRAAIAVERYFRTNNNTIRCRRFKGGKVLVFTHKGTEEHLSKSWSILLDSLVPYKQNYPLIQKHERTAQNSENPLEWTTKLYAPIE